MNTPQLQDAGPWVKLKAEWPTVAVGQPVTITAELTRGSEDRKKYVATWYAWGAGNFEQFNSRPTFLIKDSADIQMGVTGFSKDRSVIIWVPPPDRPGQYIISIWLYDLQTLVEGEHLAQADLAAFHSWADRKAGEDLKGYLAGRSARARIQIEVTAAAKEATPVTMRRAESPPTADQALWTVIRKSTSALSFQSYSDFMDIVLCGEEGESDLSAEEITQFRSRVKPRLRLPFPDVDAYRQLKVATEVFMMLNCGVKLDAPGFESVDRQGESRRYYRAIQPGDVERYWDQFLSLAQAGETPIKTLPYLSLIRRKLKDVSVVAPDVSKRGRWMQKEEEAAVECMGILMNKLTRPCLLELIWSYWHEEGMLVQTMNAITWRFQNRRGSGDRDPLALLEIDPLRPLSNFVWGFIQDEQHRLTVVRRAYEYDHHYGLAMLGKAVPQVRSADSRSRFLEAFHNLLFLCSVFFKEDDDTTVVADGFPILNGLKEVHLLLTQGAHNQYGDLPWTARQEMLMQEWLLARPEFREFLPSRIMVDYPEAWMDRVETMKTLQGWNPASILHFRDLGVFGEQVLLGARFGAWPSVIEPQQAANWARYWRPEIQGYIHAYRAVTGADLTERPSAAMPSVLLRQRLAPAGVTR